MNILVTGGAGFIGSHICDELLKTGHTVSVLDDMSAGVDFCPKGVREKTERGLLNNYIYPKYDCIVHAAARADVRFNWTSVDERQRLWNSNVAGTIALLENNRNTPVVFLSTCAVYGDDDACREDNACISTSPYAASKAAGEALIQAYAVPKATPWHILRLSCVVGSRYHHGHIRDFVDAARAGVVRPCNDGNTKKSFVHVLDVAGAVSMCVAGMIGSGVYNVATSTWSPRDTIREMGASVDCEWPENKVHGWIGDPMAVASAGRLRAAGWVPKWTVGQGVRDALESLQWRK